MANYIINSLESFKQVSLCKNFVDDETKLTEYSCSYNNTLKAFRLRDLTTTNKGSLEIKIGNLLIGDRVEVECEIMNITGTKCKIALDGGNSGGNYGIIESKQNNCFEKMKVTFTIQKDLFYLVTIGIFTADIGEIYIRNVKIKTYTSVSNFPSLPYERDIRNYTLRVIDGEIEINTAYGYDSCLLSFDETTNELILTHNNPFSGDKNGTSIVTISASNDYKYDARSRSETKLGLRIRIYDKAQGKQLTKQEILELNQFWIGVIHFGFKKNELY